MSKHIALFLPSFETGGVERNAVFFANEMYAKGYPISVFYCRKASGWFDKLDKGIEKKYIKRIPNIPLLHERLIDGVSMLLFGLSPMLKLRGQSELVLMSFQSNVIAIILGMLCRVPTVVRLSNHFDSILYETSLTRKVSEYLKSVFYQYSTTIIANSCELGRDYKKRIKGNIQVIENPIDFRRISLLQNEKVQEELFVDPQRPILISAGRLSLQKNFSGLLFALKEVVRVYPCDLCIIGEGEERLSLERLIDELNLTEYVHLLGHKNNLYKYFKRSSLFVLNSNYEGMPNVLIEAIACGLPAVSTSCKSGPTEVLESGAGGYLVPINDSKSLAKAICRTLEKPLKTQEMQKVSFAKVHEYDAKIISNKYLSLIESINC